MKPEALAAQAKQRQESMDLVVETVKATAHNQELDRKRLDLLEERVAKLEAGKGKGLWPF